jgi:thioredoxin-dependent peroxiredoxin
VSFDSPSENAAFAQKESFPFPLLSDSRARLASQLGAGDEGSKYARRMSVLVGPDSRVLRIYEKVDPATHPEEVLADLAAG